MTEPSGRVRGWASGLFRLTSLRLRLVFVFALVALTAAVSASGIAYWLNRDAVLTRTQNAALNDFRQSLADNTGSLPMRPQCERLRDAAERMADSTQRYEVVLVDRDRDDKPCAAVSRAGGFTLKAVPDSLRTAVNEERPADVGDGLPYHLYWQRITLDGDPYLVGGAKVIGGGPTGYMLKSLTTERDDLNSLAWSLGIATALALIGSALLAQAAASTVLRPVQRLGDAARQLGEGKLDTRLQVSGTDELADLSRTFNGAAASLEQRVEELSAREAASRRFVADMSHELRTPLTAITAVTEVLEDETDNLDPMIAPAVRLVVDETRRLGDLVENLMEVTRFDAGTARLVLDDVDVADMVTACIDARAWLDAVELDAERGIVARLDPRRLDVVLANLIGNALKHGGSPVRVTVRPEDSWLTVEVRDHGPGIPEDVLPHVFDRFYKASASRPRSRAADWASPSPWRTRTSTAATSPSPTTPTAAPCSGCACRWTPTPPAPERTSRDRTPRDTRRHPDTGTRTGNRTGRRSPPPASRPAGRRPGRPRPRGRRGLRHPRHLRAGGRGPRPVPGVLSGLRRPHARTGLRQGGPGRRLSGVQRPDHAGAARRAVHGRPDGGGPAAQGAGPARGAPDPTLPGRGRGRVLQRGARRAGGRGPREGDPGNALRLSRIPDELPAYALAQLVCTFAGSAAVAGDESVVLGGPDGDPLKRYPCTEELRARPEAAQTTGVPLE